MSCCHPADRPRPATAGAAAPAADPAAPSGVLDEGPRTVGEVALAGGRFAMGDAFDEGYAQDGEVPVHAVRLSPFAIDATTVTNTEFARFVEATGYRTESEVYGFSAVFHLLVRAPKRDIVGTAEGAGWWLTVRGADWAHPHGSESSWRDAADHPVVQVSWNDARAYCAWAGRSLPTEAQWEYAARGGLESRRYPWGDELHGPDGEHLCNIWQGEFPTHNTLGDGFQGTAPVKSFPPNGFGLHEVSGNVWEWCADWFLPKYYRNSPDADPAGPSIGRGRVMRGGSFLCHDSYCNRYRLSARTSNSADSASSNTGFRTVARTG
ncbi:formylglycine-generating enzyme required for sulfatase activity [Paeniglutamicibacter sulfureus]|uniref:Formylglycine-generating enzyme required for sulfatase activity n=1 Tax=Paeniglutamicibacter sulfureus TaxID=43666 RepID=A0ABU2BJA5_9MICC|nr:formylglycine-generating enzyme required for sulfatase activity [Paeniglutamicibacter sulfureus]